MLLNSPSLREKKADTRCFDINEVFENKTALDIANERGDLIFCRMIEQNGGFRYKDLHSWSLDIPKVRPPASAKEAVSKLREAQKLEWLNKIKEENQQVLAKSINPIQRAAFDAFAKRIEALLSNDARTLRSMELEINTLLEKFWALDSLIISSKNDFHLANKEITALSNQTYNNYIAGQDTDTLMAEFLKKLAAIKNMVGCSQRARSDSAFVFSATAGASQETNVRAYPQLRNSN